MVLPIIIGIGISTLSIVVRSGFRAWKSYKLLTPLMIAELNNIQIHKEPRNPQYKYSKISHELRVKLNRYPGGFYNKMTETEAILILGITPDEIECLTETTLRHKHRIAMRFNHPDKGGSPYLAMKINGAKEILEKSIILEKHI